MTLASRTLSIALVPYNPRRHLWLRRDEPLVCPNGHKLKHNAALLEHECFFCQHVEPGQRGECGARVYVMALPHGLKFVAEVTAQEMGYMRDNRMSVDDVIGYLRGRSA